MCSSDLHKLISEKGEFGVNIPTKSQLDKIHLCGSVSGKDEDKYVKASLTPKEGREIDSYVIKECPVNLECKVVHRIDYAGTHQWFIGVIKAVHIDDNYVRDDALMFWLGQFRTVGEIIEGTPNKELWP